MIYFIVYLAPTYHKKKGIVECKHHHNVEIRLTLLAHALVPTSYWDSAFQAVVHLINILLHTKSPCKSPQVVLFYKTSDYTSLRVFGCMCLSHLRSYSKNNIYFHSLSCIFFGYHPNYNVTSICIFPLVIFFSPKMLYLMSLSFSFVFVIQPSNPSTEANFLISLFPLPPLTMYLNFQHQNISRESTVPLSSIGTETPTNVPPK